MNLGVHINSLILSYRLQYVRLKAVAEGFWKTATARHDSPPSCALCNALSFQSKGWSNFTICTPHKQTQQETTSQRSGSVCFLKQWVYPHGLTEEQVKWSTSFHFSNIYTTCKLRGKSPSCEDHGRANGQDIPRPPLGLILSYLKPINTGTPTFKIRFNFKPVLPSTTRPPDYPASHPSRSEHPGILTALGYCICWKCKVWNPSLCSLLHYFLLCQLSYEQALGLFSVTLLQYASTGRFIAWVCYIVLLH